MGFFSRLFGNAKSNPMLLPAPSQAAQDSLRRALGTIHLRPETQTRWYLADVEAAQHAANQGNLSQAASLANACRADARVAGILSTRTDGCVGLPRRLSGNPEVIAALEESTSYARSELDVLAPKAELSALAADGILLGVGIGEMVPVEGLPFKVLVRLDPQYLRYRFEGNCWTYQTLAGEIPVTPGDGRWVLHCPGGRNQPWNAGLWRAVGTSWVIKTHARLAKNNWESTLANSVRIAKPPLGASEDQVDALFDAAQQWAYDSTILLPPGFDLTLLEANNRGHESFDVTIAQANEDITVAIAGQLVSTTGGTGFISSNLFEAIRDDQITGTADSLAYTVSSQIFPGYVLDRFGESYLDDTCPILAYDSRKPTDLTREASSLVTAATAISQLTEALGAHGKTLDIEALASRFQIPIAPQLPTQAPELRLVSGGDPK